MYVFFASDLLTTFDNFVVSVEFDMYIYTKETLLDLKVSHQSILMKVTLPPSMLEKIPTPIILIKC